MEMNLYEFIGVAINASQQEIDSAILSKYNEFRRLVTHHDPTVANQATSALQTLEQARATLLNPNNRDTYNQSLGLGSIAGGLADPQAILNRLTGSNLNVSFASPPVRSPGTPPQSIPQSTVVQQERLDIWTCKKCNQSNPKGTRFCKKCGDQIGFDCPNCSSLIEADGQFCQNCGVNVREYMTLKDEEEKMRAMEIAQQNRLEAERQSVLRPLISDSENAWKYTKTGCIFAFIPFLNFASIILWGMGLFYSRKALNSSQVPGDTEYRDKAKRANKWALWALVIAVFGIIIYIIGATG